MRHRVRILLLALLTGGGVLGADVPFNEPGWAIVASFPGTPKTDEVRTPSEQGEIVVKRFFYEQGSTRCMLARFSYPVVPLAAYQEDIYDRSIEEMMKSRPGEMKVNTRFELGAYGGRVIQLRHRRERTVREVRQVLVGSSLLVISAEWPGTGEPTEEVARFLRSVAVRPEYANPRQVEEEARWREIRQGSFRLRYDGSRWYRDPGDSEPGVFNLLRVDQAAEAQLIVEAEPLAGGQTIEDSVIGSAREAAESVTVRRRAKKNRSGLSFDDLEYAVRVEGVTYVNHGYFYTGPAGTVQLRGWSPEKTYRGVESDITELLDGISVIGAGK